MLTRLTIFSLSLLTAGCVSVREVPTPDDPVYAPVYPVEQEVNMVPTGSLYNTRYANSLYSDIKARRVGDIITVMLEESTQASKSAKTEITKDDEYTLDPVVTPRGNFTINGNPLQLGMNRESEFEGDSKADQSNSLDGKITVNVIKVLPNGNLVIVGEKWLTLNQGQEYIRLTGLIRPQDIDSDNTVASYKVANARIQYSGTGALADAQEQGWLTQFFNNPLWPF